MRNLAIIPARSGSKGLPNKNIKMFNGKPLMSWTIEAAIKSAMFTEVMVSTDSIEYRDIAVQYGATVPFLRSQEQASDIASSWDVVREVINNYKKQGIEFSSVCLLQPTSPLRTADDICNAYKIYNEKHADSVIAVTELEHSIKSINKLPDDGCMDGFCDVSVSVRRQDAGKYYRINGAIYIRGIDGIENEINLYGPNTYAYIMDKGRSIDIDDALDFDIAETIACRY